MKGCGELCVAWTGTGTFECDVCVIDLVAVDRVCTTYTLRTTSTGGGSTIRVVLVPGCSTFNMYVNTSNSEII